MAGVQDMDAGRAGNLLGQSRTGTHRPLMTRAVHIAEDEIDLRIVRAKADQARLRVKGGKSKMYSRLGESAGPTATQFNVAKFHQQIHLWVVQTKLKRKAERAEQERVAELIGQRTATVHWWAHTNTDPDTYGSIVTHNIGPVSWKNSREQIWDLLD
eukprot:1567522-Rhodomonas_salina.1